MKELKSDFTRAIYVSSRSACLKIVAVWHLEYDPVRILPIVANA